MVGKKYDFLGPNGTRFARAGPKKSLFSGPTPSNAPRNDVAPLKTITYRAIKTTGTLIVISPRPLMNATFNSKTHF